MFGFSSIGPFELLLILVVALVIFGPKRLPEIGKAIGQAIRSLKEQSQKLTDELTLDVPAETPRGEAPAATAPPQQPPLPQPRRGSRRPRSAAARAGRKRRA